MSELKQRRNNAELVIGLSQNYIGLKKETVKLGLNSYISRSVETKQSGGGEYRERKRERERQRETERERKRERERERERERGERERERERER